MAKGKYQEWLTEEGLTLLEGWARDGLTDEQISHNVGVTAKTLYEWKNKYSEISESLKKGKEVADYEVESATFKAAKGYYYTEETVTNKGDVVEVRKYQPPNPTLNIFWLKNRIPDKWRDKQSHELTGKDGQPIQVETKHDLTKLSDEELMNLETIIRKSTDTGTDTSGESQT